MKEDLPYSIPEYMQKICGYLRELIAEITEVEEEFISVSFLYHLQSEPDGKWHQVTETDVADEYQVKQEVERKGSLFQMLMSQERNYIYIPDKTKSVRRGEYRADMRDFMFNGRGSALGMKIDFEENGRKYVNGVLLLSVYGKNFAQADAKCKKYGKNFEYVLVYLILPYYKQLLQTECGLLYAREQTQEEAAENMERG